jgi:hypothetical protein
MPISDLTTGILEDTGYKPLGVRTLQTVRRENVVVHRDAATSVRGRRDV